MRIVGSTGTGNYSGYSSYLWFYVTTMNQASYDTKGEIKGKEQKR